MSALAFDTHAFVKRLTAAGMPEAQAEVLADEQASLIDGRIATKADLVSLVTSIHSLASKLDMFATKESVKADLSETKADILKWVIGTIGFQTLVILGAVITLAKALH